VIALMIIAFIAAIITRLSVRNFFVIGNWLSVFDPFLV